MTTMTSPSSNQRSDKFASHLDGYAAQGNRTIKTQKNDKL